MTAGFLLYSAAQCRGVQPSLFRALGSAPESSNAAMTAGFSLPLAAQCRGVKLSPRLEIRANVRAR